MVQVQKNASYYRKFVQLVTSAKLTWEPRTNLPLSLVIELERTDGTVINNNAQ